MAPELHQYFDVEADHLFVIGHENAHSLGPKAEYQNALGQYKNMIEEHKADVASIAFMPEYVKSGIITENTLKEIYTTWIVRLLLKSRPKLIQPHRLGDLIHFNALLEKGAISFSESGKLRIDFARIHPVIYQLLEETIAVQLSKSPEKAKAFIDKYGTWGDIHEHVASVQKTLGIKPYKDIRTYL